MSRLGEEARRAPGVAVDPTPELTLPTSTAPVSEAVVVLRSPPNPAGAVETVRAFLQAVLRESVSGISRLLALDARVRTGTHRGARRAVDFWQQRLARLDYAALADELVYRESEIETYRAQDLPRLRPPRRLGFGTSASENEVVVRVPILVPRRGRTRMFGDEILFLLRPDDHGYKIQEMREEFQIP